MVIMGSSRPRPVFQKKTKHGCFLRVVRDPIKKKKQRGEVNFWGWSLDLGPDPEIDERTGYRLPRSEMEAGRRPEASSWSFVLGSPPRSGLLVDEAVAALLLNEEPVLRRSFHQFHGQSSLLLPSPDRSFARRRISVSWSRRVMC
jgi:hypothetical protein